LLYQWGIFPWRGEKNKKQEEGGLTWLVRRRVQVRGEGCREEEGEIRTRKDVRKAALVMEEVVAKGREQEGRNDLICS
jgi:hypothetical protein